MQIGARWVLLTTNCPCKLTYFITFSFPSPQPKNTFQNFHSQSHNCPHFSFCGLVKVCQRHHDPIGGFQNLVKDVEIETDTVLWFHTYAPIAWKPSWVSNFFWKHALILASFFEGLMEVVVAFNKPRFRLFSRRKRWIVTCRLGRGEGGRNLKVVYCPARGVRSYYAPPFLIIKTAAIWKVTVKMKR